MLSKTFVKKRADAEKFFGYRISKQRGSKIRDGKYAREAGAQNTPPSQKKKLNLKQVWGDIKDFETFEVMYGQLFIIEFFAILRKKKSAKKVNRANISSPDMNSFQS